MADYALDSYMLRLEDTDLNTEEEPYIWMLVWDDTVNSSAVYSGSFGKSAGFTVIGDCITDCISDCISDAIN